MSGKSAQTIQQLLEAEKAAAEVVEQARKERDERLKKASLEAEAEIAAYREMLEKEYQEKLAKFKASEGDVSKMVKEREDKEIAAVKAAASKEKDAISAQLVEWVCGIDTGV
ncbi:hypothetical protein NDN08_000690 [Rhodosorus marinus]|uniref:V-type proton ATPase subunit G n=1 Tax=Rhodosorus marinus TaxID=101924 RepID=A0AAV8USX6_9RHOD|nr:hypothetical protein NDN08_000690 [Rhodosorus marinus]